MELPAANVITPTWPAPATIRALITTREGGVSRGPYASLNLGMHVGDDAQAVMENRRRLTRLLPRGPHWLQQVHGNCVLRVTESSPAASAAADAIHSSAVNQPCAVLVADCLPVLFCDSAGTEVAAAHAGWRGLCAGVLENTVAAMSARPESLMAYLGPAIGPEHFEVGSEVRAAFMAVDEGAAAVFRPQPAPGKFLADIYALARQRLTRAGVTQVYGGSHCTVSEPARFFSYRREGKTGRMAALIWRVPAES
jgi:polyphenol oxidase